LDTTGGVLTFIGNTTLSSDFPGAVHGVYGMALQPFTGDVYAIYGIESDEATERRLGTIDLSTAVITDIGEVGAANDLTFVDTTLYASMGSYADNKLVIVSTTDATITQTMLAYGTAHGGSSGVNFDYHKSRILRSIQGAPTYTAIDVNEFEEESLAHGGHPGWTNNLLTIDDESAYSLGSTTIQVLNTNTFTYTAAHTFAASNWIQCGVFGSYPLSLWVNGNRNMCAGDESILTVLGSGSEYAWFKDGVLIDGETASTLTVSEEGEYAVTVDEQELNVVTITVAPSIEDGFTISANPAYLEGEPSVEVDVAANAVGPRYTYDWSSGAGETSDEATATFTYDAIDDYLITLDVIDTVSIQRCALNSIEILEVVGGVGITEMENSLAIYPVPAQNELFVEFTANDVYGIQIIDLSGAIVFEQLMNTSGKTALDINELESGTYFCKIIGADYVIERTFIKQ
jgi:hypothetical protein